MEDKAAPPTASAGHSGTETSANRVPLSPFENLSRIVHEELQGEFVTSAILRVRGLLQPEPLRRALDHLQCCHPKLCASLEQDDKLGPVFHVPADPPTIPLKIEPSVCDEDSWLEAALEFSRTRFPPGSGPLCRVTILENQPDSRSDVVVTFHHSIVDGTSGARFLHELLRNYAHLLQHGQLPEKQVRKLISAAAVGPKRSWFDGVLEPFRALAKAVVPRRRPLKLKGDPNAWTRYVCHHRLTQETTEQISARAAREGTSTFGALAAAALLASRDVIDVDALNCGVQVPVSIRRFNSPPARHYDMGGFVASMKLEATVERTTPFWDLARHCKDQANAYIAEGRHFRSAGALSWLSSHEAVCRWLLRRVYLKPMPRNVLMVNVAGRLKIQDRYGPLQVEGILWRGNARHFASPLVVHAAVVASRLNIYLGGVEGLADGVVFRDAFYEHLRAAVGSLEFQTRHEDDAASGDQPAS